MKILLAVDGSPYTKKMLAYLTTHDELFSAAHEYVVLTVRPPLPARANTVVGKSVVVVSNLQPALLRGVESNGMLLAASSGDQVIIVSPEKDADPGSKVS